MTVGPHPTRWEALSLFYAGLVIPGSLLGPEPTTTVIEIRVCLIKLSPPYPVPLTALPCLIESACAQNSRRANNGAPRECDQTANATSGGCHTGITCGKFGVCRCAIETRPLGIDAQRSCLLHRVRRSGSFVDLCQHFGGSFSALYPVL